MKKYLTLSIGMMFFISCQCPQKALPPPAHKPSTGRVLDKPAHFIMPKEIRDRYPGFTSGSAHVLVAIYPDHSFEVKRINYISLNGSNLKLYYYDYGFTDIPLDPILEKWLISETQKVKVLIPPSEKVEGLWLFPIR